MSRTFEEWSEEDRKCFDLLPLLNLGLCLPDQCTNYDTERIIQFCEGASLILENNFRKIKIILEVPKRSFMSSWEERERGPEEIFVSRLNLLFVFLVYNAAEMSMDRKLVCKVEVECSNSRPDTQLWNNTFSVVVL